MWDRGGIALSAVCAAHCVALPAMALIFPLLRPLAGAEWIHWLFVALAAPVSLFALRGGGRAPQAFATAGLILLAAGAARIGGDVVETPVTLLGAALLLVAHWRNMHASAKPRVSAAG